MENKLTKEQVDQMTRESRYASFMWMKGELNNWWVQSDDEQKCMDSVIRAINKYINYLSK